MRKERIHMIIPEYTVPDLKTEEVIALDSWNSTFVTDIHTKSVDVRPHFSHACKENKHKLDILPCLWKSKM